MAPRDLTGILQRFVAMIMLQPDTFVLAIISLSCKPACSTAGRRNTPNAMY
jgi:hypothetical protein